MPGIEAYAADNQRKQRPRQKCPAQTATDTDLPQALQHGPVRHFSSSSLVIACRWLLKRQRLVQRMFDTAISFRLAQLKDAWRALHSAEVRLKRPLPEIRALPELPLHHLLFRKTFVVELSQPGFILAAGRIHRDTGEQRPYLGQRTLKTDLRAMQDDPRRR